MAKMDNILLPVKNNSQYLLNGLAKIVKIFLRDKEYNYMQVSATDMKNNFGKYLEQLSNEDIIITKNGKPIAKLTSFKERSAVESLSGILKGKIPNNMTDKDLKKARIEAKYGITFDD